MAAGGPTIRIAAATAAALLLGTALLANASGGRATTAGTQASAQVAVIPGFSPPAYQGYYGVPTLPVQSSQLSGYHFSQLPAAQVTASALQHFDTVLLYGIRWSDLSAAAQSAINSFARTRKVLIWDSDDTGAQNYATFIHPFSTQASGENGHANDSVVSFPGGDFLASSNPKSPSYLDPNQLVSDRNMINDMNAMSTGTHDWIPALEAANANIPKGGWAIAWTYGAIGDQTGLLVYSGLDADAFDGTVSPNYAIKELALELAAPFRQSPASSGCAPNCKPKPPTGGTVYAACRVTRPMAKTWVHGRVVVPLQTSAASGISGKILKGSGRVLASGRERKPGQLRLRVHTRRLRSNHVAHLRAVVFVNGRRACTRKFRLKVDNSKPRLLMVRTSRDARRDVLLLRVNERSSMKIVARGTKKGRRPVLIAGRRTIAVHLPRRVRKAELVIRDRAGNVRVRKLHWR